MNDGAAAEPSSNLTPVNTTTHAGDLLRTAREAQGLHIAAMAVTLKVPVKKLEALEAGRFSELPDMVFARSLALSVCRTLKINPDEILAALPGLPVPSIRLASNVNHPEFRGESAPVHASMGSQLKRPLGVTVIAVSMIVLAVLVWRGQPLTPVDNLETEPEQAVVQTPVTQSAAVSLSQEPALPAVAEPAPLAEADRPDAVQQPAVLEIRARGVSWVDVTDASGVTQLRRLTSEGEILRIAGQLPLSVVVGRADLVDITVRGQALDLLPLARDNVARFEVK